MGIPVLREEVIIVVHVEDVKAALRKRYGTLEIAQSKLGLKNTQMSDYMRGNSTSAHEAVARELGYNPEHLKVVRGIVPKSGEVSGSAAERVA